MRRLLAPAACSVALLLVAGCGDGSSSTSAARTPAGAAKDGALPELKSIGQLQRAFDADPGVPRLVILLSPT
jgi:hypothetical protein